jgi:hypothetical protein
MFIERTERVRKRYQSQNRICSVIGRSLTFSYHFLRCPVTQKQEPLRANCALIPPNPLSEAQFNKCIRIYPVL